MVVDLSESSPGDFVSVLREKLNENSLAGPICGCREQNPRCDARVGFALARCKHFIGKTHVVTLFFSSYRPLSSVDFRATRVSGRFFVRSLSNFEYDQFLV